MMGGGGAAYIFSAQTGRYKQYKDGGAASTVLTVHAGIYEHSMYVPYDVYGEEAHPARSYI
jgi:hypothetical protein